MIRRGTSLCIWLLAAWPCLAAAQGASYQGNPSDRLAPILNCIYQTGTNLLISAKSAKALGLGDGQIPAKQRSFHTPGAPDYLNFSVSDTNVNDVIVFHRNKLMGTRTSWLARPDGTIVLTAETASNCPPVLVPNEMHANEFDILVERTLLFLATRHQPKSNRTLETIPPDAEGSVHTISEQFVDGELQNLAAMLNSAQFQARLTNYNCGDPVPRLKFWVGLQKEDEVTVRGAEIYYSPRIPAWGRTRCLNSGINFLIEKAVAGLDPDPQAYDGTTREPHCDCSQRDTNQEWVTNPGPDVILAPVKVEAANAMIQRDQTVEKQLDVIHLDPAGVELEPNPGEHLVTHETLLGQLPREAQMFTVDPSLKHWAYVLDTPEGKRVVVDGVKGQSYPNIASPPGLVFSQYGGHLAFVVKQDKKIMVVADGGEGKWYDGDLEDDPAFSPDGKRLAYFVGSESSVFAVVDGVEQKHYQLADEPVFSPDGRHFAYHAEIVWNRVTVIVMDGKEGKKYNEASSIDISPDGGHLAFVASYRPGARDGSGDKDVEVVDSKEGKGYTQISWSRYSPDSQHLAYTASTSTNRILIRDGIESTSGIYNTPAFSPDSQHLVYVANFYTNFYVMIDGKKLAVQPHLTEDQASVEYASDMVFSPDSRHFAYVCSDGTNAWIILDGQKSIKCVDIVAAPIFSPDSHVLAYAINRGGKNVVVLDGRESAVYDGIATCRTSLEESRGLVFDAQGKLHALAMRNEDILDVEMELEKN